MSFSSEWLALREPVDHAARSKKIARKLAEQIAGKNPARITDIGSGTGSTIRAMRPFLGNDVRWHLTDNDDALMDLARNEAGGNETAFTIADLSHSLDPLFCKPADVITTSAFLDLVSLDWLEQLVSQVASRKLPFYAALTYDGRAMCKPELKRDGEVISAFNRHQQTDKGFGPALGPAAADTAIRLFEQAGYQVTSARSDWEGTIDRKEFQKMLLEGWAMAAIETEPVQEASFKTWFLERLRLIENGEATLMVGHKDFLAVPA